MNAKHSIPLAAALGLLVLPTSALAAPAKIGKAATVSPSGVASVKVANPNRYALKGSVRLITGQQLLASRKVKVRPRRSTTAKMRLSKGALGALRAGGMHAVVSARLGHGSHKGRWIRKSVKVTTTGAGGGNGQGGSGGGAGGGVTSNRWLATTSTGATFPLTVDGSTLNITQQPLQPVSCSEMGGQYRVSMSSEPFDLLGPWTVGNQSATQTKSVPRVNQLVTSGARTVTYKLTSSRAGNQITGTLTQSFSDSRLDFSTYPNKIIFINCAGTLNFTAVPAG
jgi:hypothetical protein